MEVLLEDNNWHPCKITGKTGALDYDGERVNIELTETTTVKPENKKKYTLNAGFVMIECHRDCVRPSAHEKECLDLLKRGLRGPGGSPV